MGCCDEMAMAVEKMAIVTHLEKSVKSDWDYDGRFASTADCYLVFI